jgi:exodeoxyribonuclease VII large subunit
VTREVRYDGVGAFQVRFGFDRDLVDLIKTLPQRRWNAAERYWSVPEQDVVPLVDLLRRHDFRFDEATRRFYELQGGDAPLERDGRGGTTVLPGLFDDEALEQLERAAAADDYSVSRLNEQVREVLEAAFPMPVWLVGEVSGFNRNAHRRHVGFQLVELEPGGKVLASVDAVLFEQTRLQLAQTLARAGDPFRLEDEVTVRVRARVELFAPWGSYRIVVEQLDVAYTLGEAARRREEIVRRLTEEGLIDLNRSLGLPPVPLRVGLVTSVGSDACADVLRTLQESGFAFQVLVHGARVQGHATEPSVLNALDALGRRAHELDVVLICRGGGSRTDLAWFDSEPLGRAVARFPLPVVVGIGHEQDRSVLDAVGWSCRTPTAAARLLVDAVRQSLEHLDRIGASVLAAAGRAVREERRSGADLGRRIGLAARSLLDRASARVAREARAVPRAARIELARQRSRLARTHRAIGQSCRRELATASELLRARTRALGPVAARFVERARERADGRARRLHLLDPRRVVERGYAILRTAGGRVLTDAELAPAGAALRAELRRGSLRLRSEGFGDRDGGG